MLTPSETYYRYEFYSYSRIPELETYPVVKHTLCCAVITYNGKPKYITNRANMYGRLVPTKKRFAYPTKEEALVAFKARKNRQLQILRGQVNQVQHVLKSIDSRQHGSANHAVREFYDNNKNIHVSAKFTQSLPRHAKLLRESVACFLHYEIAKIDTLTNADKYLKLVTTGDGICSDNAIYALRQMLTYHITGARRLHDTHIIKLAIHTYKLWKKDTRYKDPMATLRNITLESDVDFV